MFGVFPWLFLSDKGFFFFLVEYVREDMFAFAFAFHTLKLES